MKKKNIRMYKELSLTSSNPYHAICILVIAFADRCLPDRRLTLWAQGPCFTISSFLPCSPVPGTIAGNHNEHLWSIPHDYEQVSQDPWTIRVYS